MLYAGELMCIIDDCKTVDVGAGHYGEWIPVSEKMPEEYREEGDTAYSSDIVLATLYDRIHDRLFVSDRYTINGKWITRAGNSFEVLAWMPMPVPYKVKK